MDKLTIEQERDLYRNAFLGVYAMIAKKVMTGQVGRVFDPRHGMYMAVALAHCPDKGDVRDVLNAAVEQAAVTSPDWVGG